MNTLDPKLEQLLNAQICNGMPQRVPCFPGYKDNAGNETDEIYLELAHRHDPAYGYWLDGKIYYSLTREDIVTNYDLLKWYTGHSPECEPKRIGEKSLKQIENYLLFWLSSWYKPDDSNLHESYELIKTLGYEPAEREHDQF